MVKRDHNPNIKVKLMQATRLYTLLVASFLFSANASAQVFNSVPSDPALFTNVYNLPGDVLPDPNSVGGVAGETTQLNIADGDSVGNDFQAREGSELNVSGGSVGEFFLASGSVVNISGGTSGMFFHALDGSTVNISGGTLRGPIFIGGSTVNISGGFVDSDFQAFDGSTVNISGGFVGTRFLVGESSEVNISGGTVDDEFIAKAGNVNILGSVFVLDGLLLDLVPGEAFTILDRDVTLSGLLDDGSAFSFDLNSEEDFSSGNDFFSSTATLTVTSTAVPEPTSITILLLGFGLAGMRRRRSAA